MRRLLAAAILAVVTVAAAEDDVAVAANSTFVKYTGSWADLDVDTLEFDCGTAGRKPVVCYPTSLSAQLQGYVQISQAQD